MSQENVEVVRRLHDAVARFDVGSFIECCHPAVQWEENTSVYLGLRSCYQGRKEAREWFSEAIVEPWLDFKVEELEVLDVDDDCVVIDFELTTLGQTGDVETRLRIWEVYWLGQRKITRRQLFSAEAEALNAVGPEK